MTGHTQALPTLDSLQDIPLALSPRYVVIGQARFIKAYGLRKIAEQDFKYTEY